MDFIISNPCFEIWFLLHFKYSTKGYNNSDEIIKELQKYIPDYRKNTDVAPMLVERTSEAIRNAGKLEEHFVSLDRKWPGADCNPRTDVGKVVERITYRCINDICKK